MRRSARHQCLESVSLTDPGTRLVDQNHCFLLILTSELCNANLLISASVEKPTHCCTCAGSASLRLPSRLQEQDQDCTKGQY